MKIRVDSRGKGENEVFDLLSSNAEWHGNATVELAHLDIGDYLIERADGSPAICVERKTHADLAQSIKTNHHIQEQVNRMKLFRSSNPGCVLYIVYEGTIDRKWREASTGGIPNANVDMYLTCRGTRDNIHVHCTASHEHTARWIGAMAKKEGKGELTYRAPDGLAASAAQPQSAPVTESAYIRSLGASKSANLRATSQWTRVLLSIDGVGADKAIAISKAYPTCAKLVKRLREDGGKDEIAKLEVKRAKLGNAVAAKLSDIFT